MKTARQALEADTIAIILNELFKDSKDLKTQQQFDALIDRYSIRLVKLFNTKNQTP